MCYVFHWAAAGELTVFYTAYFVKMVLLRRAGVKVVHLSKGDKGGRTKAVETALKAATAAVVAVEVVSVVADWLWHSPLWLKVSGLCVAAGGTALFVASMVQMGGSWRVGIDDSGRTGLVTEGVYRWSRNPAFVGFDLVYAGVCLMFPNPAHVAVVAVTMVCFHAQILEEERHLSRVFGREYEEYRRRVRRYF